MSVGGGAWDYLRAMLRYTSFAVAVLAALLATAQSSSGKDERSLADRLWFGGGVGLSFGTFTAVQLDPMVGYKVDKEGRFMAGVGGSYWYFRDNRFTVPYDFTAYGYRTFTRYRFIENAFAHAEFLHMNVESNRFGLFSEIQPRIWVPHLLVGGGYIQSMGGRSGIFIQVLFEVIQDPNSIYFGRGPLFGGGVGFGF
jgi:hypothetical protein